MMERADLCADDDHAEESRYLGQNSIPAFLSEEARQGEGSDVQRDILPILGLDISSSPYPFMSMEQLNKVRHEVSGVLPSNREILK